MIDDLKLYKETYDFLLWLYPEIKKFPKSEKYTLGERLKNTTESLLLNIVLINKNFKGYSNICKVLRIISK